MHPRARTKKYYRSYTEEQVQEAMELVKNGISVREAFYFFHEFLPLFGQKINIQALPEPSEFF